MPKQAAPLTPSAVANAKPMPDPYRMPDGRGMFLLVQPNGARWWRMEYRRPGTHKKNMLSLGVYPDVSLKQARERREAARKLLANGIDPGEKRKAEAQAGAETFEAVAREWLAKFADQWVPEHGERIVRRFENDVFPWIGSKPIAAVSAPDILAIMQRIDARGARETAHRARSNIGQVIRYAIATGRMNFDPTPALRGAIPAPAERNLAAITEPDSVGELLRAIEGFTGSYITRCALKLAPLLFVRPGELRQAEWAEFDLDGAQWNIPAAKMKTRQPHLVPLASQAVAILRDLAPLTGGGRYVFPSVRTRQRPMSNNTVTAALRRMGYDKHTMTGHGFRAMARTILDERLGFRPDYIEHQLAHAVRDPNGRAYNRTAHLPERRKMMQAWADYLDSLREGAKVVPVHEARR